MMTNFISPFGEVTLERNQSSRADNLQAWDAADSLILEHVHSIENLDTLSILLINDSFGSLACSLNHLAPTSWTDSFIAHQSTQHNLRHNGQESQTIPLKSTESPTHKPDVVLIKLPKTLALLEHQLVLLKPLLTEESIVVAGCMVKYMGKAYFQLFEKYMGSVTTSLAKKKARLLFVKNDASIPLYVSPYPTSYYLENYDVTLINHANVFSRERLDLGARFMLDHIDRLPSAEVLVDLACGNGILGLVASINMYQQHKIQPTVHYVDESYMAIDSVQHNVKQYGTGKNYFYSSDGLKQTGISEVDLIVCNPPFHQGQAISDETAWQMIVQSKAALKMGGELWLVGNRHQQYHVKIKKIFDNYEQIGSNSKFVVIKATKQ